MTVSNKKQQVVEKIVTESEQPLCAFQRLINLAGGPDFHTPTSQYSVAVPKI